MGPASRSARRPPVSELESLSAPIGPCAANVADSEIRAQGTVGGNLCAGEGPEAPRGDLQGAFLAVGATVRSAGAGGETTEPLEDFLPHRQDRLLLDVSYEEPSAGAFAPLTRPHTHDYTALAVSAARGEDGTVRLAASGVPGHAVRLPSAEAKASDPGAAADAALDGRDVRRRRARVGLVPQANPARARPPGTHTARGGLMKLTVNGVERSFETPPLTPLLHVLREELGITSPKAGCQQGGCGSCTILVDGAPRRACLVAVAAIDGAEITTLEGLGSPEALSPIQTAFHEHYAAQCGFCTSGMVLAAHGYLEAGGTPERESIQKALAGHVCRCTGYVKIINAVAAAAGGEIEATQRWLPQTSDEAPVEIPGAPA